MKVCPKCFESNDPTAEYCTECGAPLIDGAEGSDQEVYQDLARANLLRMRGDMKSASDVCLKILRRFPNNATAHTMLGDISADQGDLQQAATWYKLAIDLSPDSTADIKKLESVQERIKQHENAESAIQIGIPDHPPKTGPFIVAVAIIVLVVGAGAYVIGKNGGSKPMSSSATIETPVNINPQSPVSPPLDSKDADPNESIGHAVDSNAFHSPAAQSDAALLSAIQSKGVEKLEYVGLTEDPRGQSAILTVKAVANEAPHITACKAGLDFFAILPAFKKITIRVLGDPGFVFVADLTDEAAKTAKAAIDGGDTLDSQSQVMLSQPWSPPHKADEGRTPESKD